MSDDREKLLKIMSSLEKDYKSGKISADKYSYFRSKYEDKLNSIDAQAATQRIRSMQGKPANNKRKRSRRPANNKRKEEQDLVQKYIINPKKEDAKYNKKEKSSMDGGTFSLLLILVLVIGFTAGVAYGVFNFDFNQPSPDTQSVGMVQDTAFLTFDESNPVSNTTSSSSNNNNNYNNTYDYSDSNYNSNNQVDTTTDSQSNQQYGSNDNSNDNSQDNQQQTDTQSDSNGQDSQNQDNGGN